VALHVVDVAIVASIPTVQGLVQAVKPISGGREVNNLLTGHIMGNEGWDGVADEHIGQLDVVPEIEPDVALRRSIDGSEVVSDLNVRAVEHRAIRGKLLDEGDKSGHLRIIDLSIKKTSRQYSCHAQPVAFFEEGLSP
jgi:hypothetical protein